jgi:hypothetical protein
MLAADSPSASDVGDGNSLPVVVNIDNAVYEIDKTWVVNGIIVPMVMRENVACFVLHKGWRNNRAWHNMFPDEVKRTHDIKLPCTTAYDILREIPRGKPNRHMRRVSASGQPQSDWVTVPIGCSGESVTVGTDFAKVVIEPSSENLRIILSLLSRELMATIDDVQVSSPCDKRTERIDDSPPIAAGSHTHTEVEDYLDAAESYKVKVESVIDAPSLPKHITYARSRNSFMVVRHAEAKLPRKDFHVRAKALCVFDEIEVQRKRALHYHLTGVVLNNPPIPEDAKRARVNNDDSDLGTPEP